MNHLRRVAFAFCTLIALASTGLAEDRSARDKRIIEKLATTLGEEKYRAKEPLFSDDLLKRLLPTLLCDKAAGAKAHGLCTSGTVFVLKGKTKDSFNVSVRLYGVTSPEAGEELLALHRESEERYNAGVEKYQKVLVKKLDDKLEIKGASKAYTYERVIERQSKKRGNIHRARIVVAAGSFMVLVELAGGEIASKDLTTRLARVVLQAVGALPNK